MRLPITGDQPAILPSGIVTGAPSGPFQPTAPSRIASAARQRSSAPSGQSRLPCSRKNLPPHGISSSANATPIAGPTIREQRARVGDHLDADAIAGEEDELVGALGGALRHRAQGSTTRAAARARARSGSRRSRSIARTQLFQRSTASTLPGGRRRLGALVPLHRVTEAVVGGGAHHVLARRGTRGSRARRRCPCSTRARTRRELGRCARAPRARHRRPPLRAELVGQRQDQRAQRVLVVRVDREDVAADALGLRRIVEQPIALGLLERVRDAVAA